MKAEILNSERLPLLRSKPVCADCQRELNDDDTCRVCDAPDLSLRRWLGMELARNVLGRQ